MLCLRPQLLRRAGYMTQRNDANALQPHSKDTEAIVRPGKEKAMKAPHEEKTETIELTHRLESATTELSNLHRDLYWLVQEQHSSEQQKTLRNLDFKQIMELKMAVDKLRDMLWKYIDAA